MTHEQMVGYPDPFAFCSNVGYVLVKEICFIKHERCLGSMKQIYFAKTCPTLLQKAEGSGYHSPCEAAFHSFVSYAYLHLSDSDLNCNGLN